MTSQGRAPNECPRCGFAYSPWKRPTPPMKEKMAVAMKARGFGLFKHANATMELQALPWRCRCGTLIRQQPTRYGWVDVAGIVIAGALWAVGCVYVPMLRHPLAGALIIGAWVSYRTMTMFKIEEVTEATSAPRYEAIN